MTDTDGSEAALVARPEPALISAEGAACAPSKAVCVRFAPDEYARLAAVAAERHMSIPEVLRLSWSLIERLEATHA